jgi:hypothetical protein
MKSWLRDRGLTLVMMGLFALFAVGQVAAGLAEFNEERSLHGEPPAPLAAYLRSGHLWEALFENWESEFLQMAVFIVFTTRLYQRGSPESRRPGVIELVDADPRRFQDRPDAPWPVRRGGVVLWLYERSLGTALFALFLLSWVGHAAGGWRLAEAEALAHQVTPPTFTAYLQSPTFWFESLQNWQSEFLSIGAMVWLAVYLRQRGSPESKPVHAAHDEHD